MSAATVAGPGPAGMAGSPAVAGSREALRIRNSHLHCFDHPHSAAVAPAGPVSAGAS